MLNTMATRRKSSARASRKPSTTKHRSRRPNATKPRSRRPSATKPRSRREGLEYIENMRKEISNRLTLTFKNIDKNEYKNDSNKKEFVCPLLPSYDISNGRCDKTEEFFNGEKEAIQEAIKLHNSDFYKKILEYPNSAYKKSEVRSTLAPHQNRNITNLYRIPLIPDDQYNCKQCIIGTFEHTSHYMFYNKYISRKFNILVAKNWDNVLNEKYVDCIINLAFSGLKDPNCKYPIRLILPKVLTKKNERDKIGTRITYLELCIILKNLRYNDRDKKKVFITHKLRKEVMNTYMPNVKDVDIYFLELNRKNSPVRGATVRSTSL